jgi:three-Cys-motif partner protein
MAKHVFGGDWTTDKLERVRKYLCAYTKIFSSNERASYLTTIYVDAFAGTGERADSSSGKTKAPSSIFDDDDAADAEALQIPREHYRRSKSPRTS